MSVLRRAADPIQLGAAHTLSFGFGWLARHHEALYRSSAHEPTTAAGKTFIRDASTIEKLVFLTRMVFSDGLRWRSAGPKMPVSDRAPALVFAGDLLAVDGLGQATLSPALRGRLAPAGALVVNLEGTVGPEPSVLHPFQTWRGVRQLLGWSESSWVSQIARRDLATFVDGLGPTWFGLANNHTLDLGAAGLARTRASVASVGAQAFGVVSEGEGGTVIDAGGRRVGVIATSFGSNHSHDEDAHLRFESVPYRLPHDRLRREIERLRGRGATYFVASLHWGYEHEHDPRPDQRRCVEELWAMGFDGIIGHHPHLVQPIVRRGPKWAAFSIGDFVGGDRTIVSRFSIALALHFFPDDVHLEVWPLVQSPYWAPAKTVLLEEAPPFEQLVWRHVFAPRVADAEGTP